MACLVFDGDHAAATRAVGGITLGLGVNLYRGLIAELRVSRLKPDENWTVHLHWHTMPRTNTFRRVLRS